MRRGEFEEILEECLSALLEGRRSVEESLSLYPGWRGRLEPLLRTAEETAAVFDVSPPSYVRERGLHRFLESARVRRRLREMFPPARPAPWWRWAGAGLTAAMFIASLSFVSVTLLASDGQELSDEVSIRPITPEPEAAVSLVPLTPLQRVQEKVQELNDALRQGEAVEEELLAELVEASSDLAESLADPEEVDLIDRATVVTVANQQIELLETLKEQSPEVESLVMAASVAAAEDVLEKVGAEPQPKPKPKPKPVASPAAVSTPEPAASPEPTITPAESPTATPEPTVTPVPSP